MCACVRVLSTPTPRKSRLLRTQILTKEEENIFYSCCMQLTHCLTLACWSARAGRAARSPDVPLAACWRSPPMTDHCPWGLGGCGTSARMLLPSAGSQWLPREMRGYPTRCFSAERSVKPRINTCIQLQGSPRSHVYWIRLGSQARVFTNCR